MLPKISHPMYEFTIPSTKKVVKYRPFLTREKKLLLIALETADDGEIIKAVKQVINNCVQDERFDVDALASFDVEMFFLQLRAKSDSETIEASFRCENPVNDKPCGNLLEVKHNISDTKVTEFPDHNKRVQFTSQTGVMMKYPTLGTLERFNKKENGSNVEVTFKFLADCVEYIYDGESIYRPNEMKPGELYEFLDSLPTQQYEKVEKFLTTMPVVKNTIKHKCSKCAFEHEIAMEGLTSFFG